MLPISILTIVYQREAALLNLLKGLERAEIKPAELVIVFMNQAPYAIPVTSFPVKTYHIARHGYMPLAEARNLAAFKASYDRLVFLDVDCIPGADLLNIYTESFKQADNLWTGPVRYLEKGAVMDGNVFDNLDERSKPDVIRNVATPITYELFWSLNFGCTKRIFERIGGFDETFKGYGAEDTDFSFSAKENGVKISWVNALAYHQYHSSYDPPLNHLADIVSNAQTFKQKWGVWPMTGWLRKFQRSGYIQWDEQILKINTFPTVEQIEASIKR